MADATLLRPLASFLALRGRFLLAIGALGMAAVVATTWQSDELDRDLLLARARFGGLAVKRHEPLVSQLDREADPGERRVAAARLLFSGRGSLQEKRPDTVDQRLRTLTTVETFASEALEQLPGNWEASMLLGVARFEKLLVVRDTHLFSAATRWELPMSAAVARSHGGSIAEQGLAAAYLEVYPALSPERRPQVAEVLRHSLADQIFRRRYIERWLTVAGSLDRAAALLPGDSETLGVLATAAWRKNDTANAMEYWSKQRRQLYSEVAGTLEAALTRSKALTDTPANALISVVANSLVDQEFAPLVQQALTKVPVRRVIDTRVTAAAVRWLAWAEPYCMISGCPLPAASFTKLSALAAPRVNTETAAFAALAAGDTKRVEQLARDTSALATEGWANYVLFAAKRHLDAKEPGKAALLLNRVHTSAQDRPLWLSLWRRTGLPDRPEKAPLLRQESWGPSAWRRIQGWTTLELGIGRRSPGLRIAFADATKANLLLGLEWDARRLEPRLVRSGERSIHLELDIDPGIHLLRLWAQAGPMPQPATTTLD